MKAIIINSMPRSGSNILWNLIGSSPDVQMTRTEFAGFCGYNRNFAVKIMMRMGALCPAVPIAKQYVRDMATCSARDAISFDTQLYKSRGMDKEAERVVCFKMMGGDNIFNALVARSFDEVRFVFMTRDGAGVCDSLYRRGVSAEDAAEFYYKTMTRMLEQHRKTGGIFVKYEELMSDVKGVTEALLCDLQVSNPADNLYLYKTKGFGPGEEDSAAAKHEKILVSLPELQEKLQFKTREDYLKSVPKDYWGVFYSQCRDVMVDIGYPKYGG